MPPDHGARLGVRPLRQMVQVLKARSPTRVLIVYEHPLFRDIITDLLRESIVGTLERATTGLAVMVDTIDTARANVVIIEREADGNTAWYILLAGAGVSRVLVLDMDRELVREYEVRSSPIRSLEDLRLLLE